MLNSKYLNLDTNYNLFIHSSTDGHLIGPVFCYCKYFNRNLCMYSVWHRYKGFLKQQFKMLGLWVFLHIHFLSFAYSIFQYCNIAKITLKCVILFQSPSSTVWNFWFSTASTNIWFYLLYFSNLTVVKWNHH